MKIRILVALEGEEGRSRPVSKGRSLPRVYGIFRGTRINSEGSDERGRRLRSLLFLGMGGELLSVGRQDSSRR